LWTTRRPTSWFTGQGEQSNDPERFGALLERVVEYLKPRDLFVEDLYCGADPVYRLPIRVVAEQAWQAAFAHQLFVRPEAAALATHAPEFTVIAGRGSRPCRSVTGPLPPPLFWPILRGALF